MDTKGMFKEWWFGRFTINKGNYSLWVSNGFGFFRDYDDATMYILRGLNIFQRYRVWREYKRELKRRSMYNIDMMSRLANMNENIKKIISRV